MLVFLTHFRLQLIDDFAQRLIGLIWAGRIVQIDTGPDISEVVASRTDNVDLS